MKTYIVKQGDNLSKIGARFGVSVSDLVKWNGIKNPDLIRIGQEIKIYSNAGEQTADFFIGKVTTKALPLNIRSQANISSFVLGTLPRGAEVMIAYETGGWGKLYGRQGFVSMAFITKI